MKTSQKDISDLKNKTLRGMSTLIIRESIMKLFAIGGQFILIRLLIPEYFGIFAILTFIENTAEIFTDVGLGQAIIQKKTIVTNRELSSIFQIRMLLSILIFIIYFIVSPYLLFFFIKGNTQFIFMVRILGIIMLIKPYRLTLSSILERNLLYSTISFIDLSGIFVYYIVAIVFAFLHLGVWSFIFAVVIKELLEVSIMIFVKKWLPEFSFDLNSIKGILHFGKYLQAGAISNYLIESGSPVLAGKLTGIQSVGFLNFSANIATLPNVLIENFGRVAFAGFSRLQNNLPLITSTVEKSIVLLNIIVFLFIVLVFGFSKEAISYVFTNNWNPAIPALYWLTAGAFFYGANVTTGHALLAIGKSKIIFYISFFPIIVQWISPLILISHFGFTAIAAGVFLSDVVIFILSLLLLYKSNIFINFRHTFLRTSTVLILCLVFSFFINTFISGSFVLFMIKVFVTMVFYIFLLTIFLKKEFYQLISFSLIAVKRRSQLGIYSV